jgi:hypothetical protein
MSFRRIGYARASLVIGRYDKEGYLKIPTQYRKYFIDKRVKLLFDPEKNLLALQPSDDPNDFPTSYWRVWCSAFIRSYNIPAQKVPVVWDEKNKYLIARIKRQ